MTSGTPERVLGFDVGARRVGVACGSRVTGGAQPLEVIGYRSGEIDWTAVERLLREWRPEALVVGLPLTLDGLEQPATALARAFAASAQVRYALPVIFQDESHSSREAAMRFAVARRAGTRRKRDANTLDSLAAVIIVERFFARPRTTGSQLEES